MDKVSTILCKYVAYFAASGTIALIGFFVFLARANAAQEERDKMQDMRAEFQETQIELLRKENREDHNKIESLLQEALKRPQGQGGVK